MAMIAPATLVAAPARTPLPFGLGSVVAWRTGERWESGVEFDGITCDPATGFGGPQCEPASPPDRDSENVPSHGEGTTFHILGSDVCSPIGGGGFQGNQDRARAHLEAREEARVEQALWTGDLGNTPNFSGANGYDAPLDVGAYDKAKKALAAVEQGIAEQYGSLGVIHVSRATATLLDLEKRGGRLYTPLDTPVVAGAGYPDGEIVGSPAIFGYRSDIYTNSSRAGDLLNRETNEMYAGAERAYVLAFDPCPVVHATFTELAEEA